MASRNQGSVHELGIEIAFGDRRGNLYVENSSARMQNGSCPSRLHRDAQRSCDWLTRFNKRGVDTRVQTAIAATSRTIYPWSCPSSPWKIGSWLADLVLLLTDTNAALRAAEIEADAILMEAKMGLYLLTMPIRKRCFSVNSENWLTGDVINKGLASRDSTASTFSMDNAHWLPAVF